jgi:uncharacterized protein involved in response to NO
LSLTGPAVSRPLLSSGFRPFFLLAAIYGPVSLGLWLVARHTGSPAYAADPLWHAHEMLFGFAAALVCGVLLTALPSWSGAAELSGRPLAGLALLWLAGRVAMQAGQWLPQPLVTVVDAALLPALCLLLLLTISSARRRLFWWTLPPLAAFALANVGFHLASAHGAVDRSQWALMLGVHALVFLFALYGGLFIPAFTRRFLQQRGEPAMAILMPLEYATAVVMVAFAAADLLDAPPAWMAAAALTAAAVHAWRFLRWRGWRTTGEPLLWCIHLGYAWLIVALLLRAAAALTAAVPRDAWVHAFTIGAYGMLKIGLMTRVVLRHTGRPVHAPAVMQIAFVMVPAAAVLRLGFAVHEFGEWALVASAMLWGGAFLTYLVLFAPMLLRSSLPRR